MSCHTSTAVSFDEWRQMSVTQRKMHTTRRLSELQKAKTTEAIELKKREDTETKQHNRALSAIRR